MKKSIGCSCYNCKRPVRPIKHFVAQDGRILCHKCRKKEKAIPDKTSAIK